MRIPGSTTQIVESVYWKRNWCKRSGQLVKSVLKKIRSSNQYPLAVLSFLNGRRTQRCVLFLTVSWDRGLQECQMVLISYHSRLESCGGEAIGSRQSVFFEDQGFYSKDFSPKNWLHGSKFEGSFIIPNSQHLENPVSSIPNPSYYKDPYNGSSGDNDKILFKLLEVLSRCGLARCSDETLVREDAKTIKVSVKDLIFEFFARAMSNLGMQRRTHYHGVVGVKRLWKADDPATTRSDCAPCNQEINLTQSDLSFLCIAPRLWPSGSLSKWLYTHLGTIVEAAAVSLPNLAQRRFMLFSKALLHYKKLCCFAVLAVRL
ncbi:hypothetical protein Tco_0304518 [Tanacetum coccineum]